MTRDKSHKIKDGAPCANRTPRRALLALCWRALLSLSYMYITQLN